MSIKYPKWRYASADLYPRRCSLCRVPKGAADFGNKKGGRLLSYCKSCQRDRHSRYMETAPGAKDRERKSKRDRYARSPQVRAERAASSAKQRSQVTAPDVVDRRHRLIWTGPELELLTRRDLTSVEIAKRIGRTVVAVQHQRRNVRRDPRYARLAGLETPEARLADPGNMNIAFTRDPLGE